MSAAANLIRHVNERIRAVSIAWVDASEPAEFLCECDDPNCVAVVNLSCADYDEIRAVPERFVVLRGHELSGADIVQQADGYLVVELRIAA